ncbi:hypothetical protein N9N67_08675 [Bacteriovoracaceae bacterium]|nr:hypothetical protein [Bacteriovoracaceae bacterium]
MELKLILLFVLLLSGNRLYSATAYRPVSATLQKGRSMISLEGTYWESTSRIDEFGEEVEFEEDEYYNRLGGHAAASFGHTDRFQSTLGVIGSSVISSEVDPSDPNSSIELENAGVERGYLHVMYSFLPTDKWQFSLLGKYSSAFFSNPKYDAENRDFVALGDDVGVASAGGSMVYFSGHNNFFTIRSIYHRPSSRQSTEIETKVEFALSWRMVAITAGVDFTYSMQNDPYTADPENKPAIPRGSTYLYNSVNRAYSAPYLGLVFNFKKDWRIGVTGQVVNSGVSTDLGYQGMISITKISGSKKEADIRNERFKSYTIEGKVIKLSPKDKYVVIDQGRVEGLEKGSRVDFYHYDFLGGNKLLATGIVIRASSSKSIVKIKKRYSRRPIEEGTKARSGLIKE